MTAFAISSSRYSLLPRRPMRREASGCMSTPMTKAAKALSGIRIEDDIHEAEPVAALTALEDICEPNGPGVSSSPRASLCRCSGKPRAWAGWMGGKRPAGSFDELKTVAPGDLALPMTASKARPRSSLPVRAIRARADRRKMSTRASAPSSINQSQVVESDYQIHRMSLSPPSGLRVNLSAALRRHRHRARDHCEHAAKRLSHDS